MKEKTNKDNKHISEKEIEEIFEVTWRNWASRRRCEQAHVPEYIKKQEGTKNSKIEL